MGPSPLEFLRYTLCWLSHIGKAPHLGSSLSCLDLIYLTYTHFLQISLDAMEDINRDRFILSKGHAITTLYSVLAEINFFPKQLLTTFNQDGSSLPEHPSYHCVPGVEVASGSLGHGLSIGCGLALGGKIRQKENKVVVLLSDGEMNEGSIWEAALFAPKHRLKNLIGIIDFNKWQATGRSQEIMQIDPLKDKWESFGWEVWEIEGHDHGQILETFQKVRSSDKPSMIIAHTVKGKGISFMEDDNNWHYRIPNLDELEQIKQELHIV